MEKTLGLFPVLTGRERAAEAGGQARIANTPVCRHTVENGSRITRLQFNPWDFTA